MDTPEQIADATLAATRPQGGGWTAATVRDALLAAVRQARLGAPAAETFTNDDGIAFTPVSTGRSIGYRVTDPDGATEYVLLAPSGSHQVNLDNGASADTFIYTVDAEGAAQWAAEANAPGTGTALLDLGSPLGFVNHFVKQPAR